MLEIHSIRSFGRPEEYDAVCAIVRSLKRPIRDVEQLTALSPEYSIFRRYLQLRDAGAWNADSFAREYVPAFIRQIKNDPAALAHLADISARSAAGERIALLCFCSDESLCHRSIIAGILRGAYGCDVRTERALDYTLYARYFQTLL